MLKYKSNRSKYELKYEMKYGLYYEMKCELKYGLFFAAYYGHLDILSYLTSIGYIPTTETVFAAARNGQINIIKYL